MLDKLKDFFKKNYTIITIEIFYLIVIVPLCLLNNEYLNLVASNNIDTGSILGSILSLFNTTESNTFYNQNAMYHSFYGYPYNSLLFTIFSFLKTIGFNQTDNFSVFAAIGRLFSLSISMLTIFYFYKVTKIFLKYFYTRISAILFIIFFPSYFFYSFQLKQDIFGIFFSLLCYLNLYFYFIKNKNKSLIFVIIFFTLATLNKQPFIFLLIPIILTLIYKSFFIDKKIPIIQIVLGILVSIFLAFIIHPYMFLDFPAFAARQSLLFSGCQAQNMLLTAKEWFKIIFSSSYLTFITISPLILFIYLFFVKIRKKIKNSKMWFFLLFTTFYVFFYLVWLILKTGPMKSDAYFLPILPFSILLIVILIERITKNITSIMKPSFFIFINFILIISVITIDFHHTYKIFFDNHVFNQNPDIIIAKEINNFAFDKPRKSINILHTVSIPIDPNEFKTTTNTWQFGDIEMMKSKICITYIPDVVILNIHYVYEKDIKLWQEILANCNLTKHTLQKDHFLFYY